MSAQTAPGPSTGMPMEPELMLFVAAAVLTVIVAVVVGLLIRRALREERAREQRERQGAP